MADVTDLTLTAEDLADAMAALRDAWRRRHPGILDDLLPEAIRMSERRPGPTATTLAERVHSGLLVALWLEPEAAAELAQDGGEPAENLHITLAYVPDADGWDELKTARAIAAVDRAVLWRPVLDGRIGGYGRFTASETSDAMDVFYASVDIPRLEDLRESVDMYLREVGIQPSEAHGYTPHCTLAYLDPDAANPVDRLPDLDLTFRAVTVMIGERRIDIPLSSDALAFAEPASLRPARGVGKNGQVFHDFRRARTFSGSDTWVQFLPPPGTYHHVAYGELEFTAEKYARIVANFQDGIYGQTLPINAEHDMPSSGAIGYITDMRIADDGSIEVHPEWNDRGQQLIEGDRFRYVSAEYFEAWQDPVTGDWHNDVAFGMAICTNPHFKETVLRPLAASEARRTTQPAPRREGDEGMTSPTNEKPGEKPDENRTVTLTEEEVTRLREADRRLTAAEQRAETAEGQVKDLTDRVSSMEQDARHKRFTDLVAGRGGSNDGQPWFGDPGKHVALLETIADTTGGEDSDQVTQYIEQQQGIAAQLKSSNLFTEIGTSRGGDSDVETKLSAAIEKIRTSDPTLTREQAEAQAYTEDPSLYEAVLKEGN